HRHHPRPPPFPTRRSSDLGSLALCSPIDLDLEVTPKADPFIKAIATCKDTVQLNMTPAGRLSIKSGSFRAFVDCTDEAYPDIQPDRKSTRLNSSHVKISYA